MSNCALTDRTTIATKWLFGYSGWKNVCVQVNIGPHGRTDRHRDDRRDTHAHVQTKSSTFNMHSLVCALFIALRLNNCQGNYCNWFFAFKQNELTTFSLAPKISEPQLFILFANYSCTMRHHIVRRETVVACVVYVVVKLQPSRADACNFSKSVCVVFIHKNR